MRTQFIFSFFLIFVLNGYSQESLDQKTKTPNSFNIQLGANLDLDSSFTKTTPMSLDVKAIFNKLVFQDGIGYKQVPARIGSMASTPDIALSIISFSAVPIEIMAGQSTTLIPIFDNGTSATIIDPSGNGIGPVASGGAYIVTPQLTGTYELVVDGAGGERVTRTVTVNVKNGFPQFLQQGPKLVVTDNVGNAQLGSSVSISADGNTAIVGGKSDSNGAGAAWIWTRNGGVWTQGPKLVGSDTSGPYSGLGGGVAISADGNTAIVGGWNDIGTWVFTRSGNDWTQQGTKLIPTSVPGFGPFAGQGSSVAISADGNTAIIGGPLDDNTNFSGAAWIWTRNGGVWTQQGSKLFGSSAVGRFVMQGTSVSISADGNTAIIGGYGDNNYAGAAWIWTKSEGVWTQQGLKLVGSGAVGGTNGGNGTVGQGYSVSLSADGNTAIVGGLFDGVLPSNNTGAAWIWTRDGGVWTQQGPKLVGPGGISASTVQGFSVSLSADGNTALVGGAAGYSQTASALVWKRSGGVWSHQGTKMVGSYAMGIGNGQSPVVSVSLSADGNTAIVGGCGDNGSAGAVWVFSMVFTAPVISQVGLTLTSSALSGNQWYNQNGIINGATNQSYTVVSNGIYYVIVTMDGYVSEPSNSITLQISNQDYTQNIPLIAGWNIISSNVVPSITNLKDMVQPLIDGGKLNKVMDESGKVIEDFGAFGGWQNGIGTFSQTEGYKVNMTGTDTIVIQGNAVKLPFSISLSAGWNIIPYPCANAQSALTMVQSLIDIHTLDKVMDESGKVIEDFGAYGGWKNNIGDFTAGKGYKIKVNQSCTLTINSSELRSATKVPTVLPSAYFTKAFSGNGTDHMNIHLVDLAASALQVGDEIGIFDGKVCVGSAAIGEDQLSDGSISIPASCNDALGGTVNGYIPGHPVELRLYREGETFDLTLENLRGSDTFEKDGSLFAKIKSKQPTDVSNTDGSILFLCHPNPFAEEIQIDVRNMASTKITVDIYNLFGQKIKMLYQGANTGLLHLKWNGTNDKGNRIVAGVYLCRVNDQSKKIVFIGGE